MDVSKKLTSLQEISKAQLSKILSANPNTKYLILEPEIIRPLEKVCGVKWLKGNGVEKIFKLDSTAPTFSATAVYYMIYANTKVFTKVVDQIRSQVDIENPVRNKFHIIVVPQILHYFEQLLEELGLLHSAITLHRFQWMPLHLDTNVLTLEIPNLFNNLFVCQNLTYLPVLSRILWQIGFVVGKPTFILTLGNYSNSLLKQYDMMCEDNGETDKFDSDFGGLVIIDRTMDYASSLLTPGTYSALLNEVYNVNVGVCENTEESDQQYDSKCNPVTKKKIINFPLDSVQDSVYADIKNRYFTEVTTVLSNLTKQLKSEKLSSEDMALDEIKRYVQTQLQVTKTRKKNITNHLNAAESIIQKLGHRYENQREVEGNIIKNSNKSRNFSYLEEILVTENDPYTSLRLLCLISITQTLSDSEIQSFRRKYLQQFGYKNGYTFHNLVTCGFISEPAQSTSKLPTKILKFPKFNSKNFYTNAKNIKQIINEPEKVNLKYPTCASYVFGGLYIPLIVQIAGMILSATPLDDIKLKLEPLGPLTLRNDRGFPLQSRSLLIYVIGGVTYAEIAACNLLETITGAKICILSDKIISGNDLMRSVLKFPS
ncbi:unnamed protein product [Brassicogethes aeneus]|uniref:Vacuolar protein sorting-associated protein 33B n=1 Tax=Brassicogethes aeneus TaxID=1431903 RepID=A0A9P0AYX6_BRAAE|nr:unnamed protein product [Brassicogethes aeneus]